MTAEIVDLVAVRNARRQPAPEPTPEQKAAQDFLDLFVPLASVPKMRSRKRPRPLGNGAKPGCGGWAGDLCLW
jgi:hypothetical protein